MASGSGGLAAGAEGGVSQGSLQSDLASEGTAANPDLSPAIVPVIETDQVAQSCNLGPGAPLSSISSRSLSAVLEGVHGAVEEGFDSFKGAVASITPKWF